MFSQPHRFHGYGSLRNVYKHGVGVRGSLISLRYAVRGPHKPYRVAVVVSRKVSKSAVKRNRIRRRVYAVVRRLEDSIPAGTDLVFTVFSAQTADTESAKLQALVEKLLNQVGVPH
jgi:ribonuclease P protein component